MIGSNASRKVCRFKLNQVNGGVLQLQATGKWEKMGKFFPPSNILFFLCLMAYCGHSRSKKGEHFGQKTQKCLQKSQKYYTKIPQNFWVWKVKRWRVKKNWKKKLRDFQEEKKKTFRNFWLPLFGKKNPNFFWNTSVFFKLFFYFSYFKKKKSWQIVEKVSNQYRGGARETIILKIFWKNARFFQANFQLLKLTIQKGIERRQDVEWR